MPYLTVYLHLVWSTKYRQPLLKGNIRKKVFQHIKLNALAHEIYVDHIGGFEDHVHCLVLLKKDQTISSLVKQIKGESSHWINRNKLTPTKFQWQRQYYAVSVDLTRLQIIRNYIRNQEKHHKNKTLQNELNNLY
jgi:REP element-mobilizing transposase RayT